MKKKIIIVLLAVLFAGSTAARPKKYKLIRDGFGLSGVDGTIVTTEDGKLFFKFESDLSVDMTTLDVGTELELLPSSELETIASQLKGRSGLTFRLWGKVTAYKGKNYIFSIYFLPITVKQENTQKKEVLQNVEKPEAINAPKDELSVPPALAAKLAKRRIIRTEDLKKGLKLEQDSILADRIGYITYDEKGQPLFVLDGLGRNVPKISIKLLKCSLLELAQTKQQHALNKLRFKAAGIVTKYKGENYILLHRIRRIHSHGNFPY